MFLGVEHTAISSPNPQNLAQWYVDHLGFRINHVTPGAFFVRAADGTMMEIIQSDDAPPPQTMADNRRAGIRHFAIAVSDFDSALADLRRKNVRFVSEPYLHGANRLVFFNDADGNLFHLIQRESPLP